jgi:signal transduction histidine kinase
VNHALSESTTNNLLLPARRATWKYIGGLAPLVVVLGALVYWLASVLYERAHWSEETDRATIREWIDEARNFRKTLPELVKEYVRLREDDPTGQADPQRLTNKRAELFEHMRALAEPTRSYVNQLPLFPEIYKLEVEFMKEKIAWVSTVPKPIRPQRNALQTLEYPPFGDGDGRAIIRCEYRLHAFNKLQRREEEQQQMSLLAGALLLTAMLLAVLFVTRFLRRERKREMERLVAIAEAEHNEVQLLQSLRRQDEGEKAQRELQRRTEEAERTALEMKSQLYASIGIMAGSYAHNIKNLLVRPNDLLSRCLDDARLSGEQQGMISEVKHTLGTVTERLQQILRTVRRDPASGEVTAVDLCALLRETAHTWTDMAREKWKLNLVFDLPTEPLVISGDSSHLQQAIENLLFNARDATFEMRNQLRESARAEAGNRKQKLLEAAAWKGEVQLRLRVEQTQVIFEVSDNGIGMTADVKAKCLRTHFSTKRDNAIYEGYSAGMGLGLSFVAMVLEHHRANLTIESAPHHGTTFRVVFPRSNVNDTPAPAA